MDNKENHNTHILSDGTSSGNSYKYDNYGKLITDSIDDINNDEMTNKKKRKKNNESIIDDNKNKIKNLIKNSYDKDKDFDDTELINVRKKENNYYEINNDIFKGFSGKKDDNNNNEIKFKENNNNINNKIKKKEKRELLENKNDSILNISDDLFHKKIKRYNSTRINHTYPKISIFNKNNKSNNSEIIKSKINNSFSKILNLNESNGINFYKNRISQNNIDKKNNNVILPKTERMYITRIIIIKKMNKIYPQVSNKRFFITKDKKTLDLYKKPYNLYKEIRDNNKNKKQIKYIKISTLKKNERRVDKNIAGFFSPLNIKKNKINYVPNSEGQNKKIIFDNNIMKKFLKKKNTIIENIKNNNSLEKSDKSIFKRKISINYRNKSSHNNNYFINRNNDIFIISCNNFNKKNKYSFNKTSQRNHLSKIEGIKIKKNLLKMNDLNKTSKKINNDIFVHLHEFKKHFGKEEHCPLCINRENNGIKTLKKLSSAKIDLRSYNNNTYYKKYNRHFNILNDGKYNEEFHNNFINELNKNNKNETALFDKKIFFIKENKKHNNNCNNNNCHSLSLPIKKSIKTGKQSLFPIIYNYFG